MKSARIPLFRFALAAGCLALVAASVLDFRDWRRQRDELVALLREAGLDSRGDGVIDRVQQERTPHHARILAARALIYDVLDARSAETIAVGSGEGAALEIGSVEWQAAVDRLPAAAELARRVLAAQPNSWQAAMLLGAATYLERSIRRDRRLYTAHHDWEKPLQQALREAPGQAEPRRFLAAAYLEVWAALSADKKDLARQLLREAFANDDSALLTLLPVWLEVAGDLDEAFALIPDRSHAWQGIERVFAARHQWDAFCRAHARLLESLLRESEARLGEAQERMRLGELFRSRSLLLQVVARAPLDTRFAPLVARALERYPPGLHGLKSTAPLRDWLRWALELHTFGRNPLPPQVVSRLAGAAGQIETPEAAMAAIVGGELYNAQRLEQLADTLTSEDWGPYLLAKTRWYLERGRIDEATATLSATDRATRRELAYAVTRQQLARAHGDLVELATAERGLDDFRRREWSAGEWRWQGNRATLRMLPADGARGLALALNRVPSAGAVVEILWDGQSVALQPVTAEGEVEIVMPVDPQPHVLELRMVAGEPLLPGRVALLDGPTLPLFE